MDAVRVVLRALEIFRALHPGVTVHQVMVFLYVAENEGLLVRDIASLSGFTQSSASRSLRANGMPGSAWASWPALGLLEAFLAEHDGRSHAIYLSEAGRTIRDQLQALLTEAPAESPAKVPNHAH